MVAHYPDAAKGYSYIVRFMCPASRYGAVLAKYFKSLGVKCLSVVKAEASILNIWVSKLEKALEPDQKLTVLENFSTSETNFRPIIARLHAEQGFDWLGVYLFSPQLVPFLRQAKELNLKAKIFGATTLESKTIMGPAAGLIEGAIYAHIGVSDEFLNTYSRRFGDDAQVSYAGNAYDFAMLAAKLFGSGPAPLAAEILKRLQVPAYDGVCGALNFKEDPRVGKYFEFPVVVKQVRQGRLVQVYPQ